ncbi:PREDICTED: shugoshin-like 2 isoform X2 [Chinchilla lanigera]|nr:PREDICTED: shugoshin-like 2 isoform X2 [Chinchilla lanigera]XP_013367365.1 PREDICTED: shugoshin-like 2 isoform X2 [Chinchilla lanigera]
MESPGMRPDLVTSAIKRRVKDKRASKTTLNVSLASKIKTKIINNSSIFKISLKHNNRALAQALSREKENSRRIATEKMLLQKEVEKLNFKNTFLQLKLDNLNKKLIEIESLLSNNLITAIEMSNLSEFHQSSFLPSTGKKKRPSRQCELTRLPFARVPLPSNDDDDDDDKEKTPRDSSVAPRVSPDAPSSGSVRQSAPTQRTVDTLFLKENSWNMQGPEDAEHVSSSVTVPSKESHSHLDRSSQHAVVDEMTSDLCSSHGREKLSLSNVTARKKRGSCWASGSPPAGVPCRAGSGQQRSLSPALGWGMETKDCANGKSITVPGNPPGLAGPQDPPAPCEKPRTDSAGHVQGGGDPQGQATVYGADMELTATDANTIITVSRGSRRTSNKKMSDSEGQALRKVRDRSSETKRERPKKRCKMSAGVDAEGQAESGPEGSCALTGGRGDSGDADSVPSAAQLPPAKPLRKTTLPRGSGPADGHGAQCSREEEGESVGGEQGLASSSSPRAGGATRAGGVHQPQNGIPRSKSKASRQTFVIRKLGKDCLFPNQEGIETVPGNLEVAHEFQTADLSSKENENLRACETQNMVTMKTCVTDRQPAQQGPSKVSKLKQKVNRKTEIISQVNQRYEDNGQDVHASQQRSIFFQPQVGKETVSGNLGVSEDFQILSPFMRDHGNLCDHETQNFLDLHNPVTPMYPVQQNESRINKKLRQKVNRKTQIISEVNHFDDKSWCCSEKGNSTFPQKGRETIPGDPKDLNEFQPPALPTWDSGQLCAYETQNISAVKKQIRGVQTACQNDSEARKLRGKGHQSAEIISEPTRSCVSRGQGLQALEQDNFASLTQKDAEIISENSEVTREFQTVDLPTKDHGSLCDYETQKSCVTSVQLPQQKESKTSKKPRQKVNRKTEIISDMIQVCEGIDNDVHGQKSYSEDLDFKVSKSEPRLDPQGLVGESCVEIHHDVVPHPSKLVKKHRRKSSGKARSTLRRAQSTLPLPSAGSSQTPATSEASGPHRSSGPQCTAQGPAAQPEPQRPRPVTPDTKGDVPWVEARKAGQCQATEVTRATPRAKRGKTSTARPPRSKGALALTPLAAHRRPAGGEHADQENGGGSDRSVGAQLDCYTKVLPPFSQIHPPPVQRSSDGVSEGSAPESVSSSKILVIKDHSAPELSPNRQGRGDGHEKTKEVRASVGRRAQKPEAGNRTLQDLTNTSFFPRNTAKSACQSGEGPSPPPSKKRRCTPLSLKEPSLKRKMRR